MTAARRYGCGGVYRSLREWSVVTGIHSHTLYDRLSRGMSMQDALTTPPSHEGKIGHTHPVECCGQTHHIAEWAEITGIKPSTIEHRLGQGWPVQDALSAPILPTYTETILALLDREMTTREIQTALAGMGRQTSREYVTEILYKLEKGGRIGRRTEPAAKYVQNVWHKKDSGVTENVL